MQFQQCSCLCTLHSHWCGHSTCQVAAPASLHEHPVPGYTDESLKAHSPGGPVALLPTLVALPLPTLVALVALLTGPLSATAPGNTEAAPAPAPVPTPAGAVGGTASGSNCCGAAGEGRGEGRGDSGAVVNTVTPGMFARPNAVATREAFGLGSGRSSTPVGSCCRLRVACGSGGCGGTLQVPEKRCCVWVEAAAAGTGWEVV
jgi:hypothetical protein